MSIRFIETSGCFGPKEFDNEQELEAAIRPELDGVIRDDTGQIVQVRRDQNNPKFKGFLITWVRESILLSNYEGEDD